MSSITRFGLVLEVACAALGAAFDSPAAFWGGILMCVVMIADEICDALKGRA